MILHHSENPAINPSKNSMADFADLGSACVSYSRIRTLESSSPQSPDPNAQASILKAGR
jgi:hypothetical protein